MKRFIIKLICLLLPIKSWRKKLREVTGVKKSFFQPESKLAHKYLDGLNGFEIGASRQNSFGLDKTPGTYGNIDFSADQGNWQNKNIKPAIINIVASGDNLPFKDDTLDYIITSHVVEHFFDPIKAIKEWLRVVKKGGYVFMIIPHKERTFDKNREETFAKELMDRHEGKLKITDYMYMTEEEKNKVNFTEEGEKGSDNPHQLITDKVTKGWSRFKEDDHHHWNVWLLRIM